MTTQALPGYGGKLYNGGGTGAAYTVIAQLRKFKFGGIKVEFEDITNLDSPAAPGGALYKEWLKTMVDGGSVTFDGVLQPGDPSTQALIANQQASPANALEYWQIKLANSTTTFTFLAYVETFDLSNEYNKAVPLNGGLKIVGVVAVTW
jgi:hypothetical protein